MTNLVAYIPVPNQQYLKWIGSHADSQLFLIEQKMAALLLPRLARNMGSLPSQTVVRMLCAIFPSMRIVSSFHPDELSLPEWESCIMPDEDVCHLLAEKYLIPFGCKVGFESIWARWDMIAMVSQQPVSNFEISRDPIDLSRLDFTRKLAEQSPDWWRQVGAVAFCEEKQIAYAHNTHMPNEYEAGIFGDPSANRDAGEKTKISLALHAEQAVVATCALKGIALEGASLYVTTFPCPDCARMIVAAGFKKVFFGEGYSVLGAQEVLSSYGVEIIRVESPGSA